MIAKDVFPVYGQYNEDIILAALLFKVDKGFYVDVGANHEKYHSVTKHFYDKGWSGINIEPIDRLINEFISKRPRDINLPIAISTQKGELEFREYPDYDGLSTLSADSKIDPTKVDLPHNDYKVQVDSLKNVFAKHKATTIDFLKIDVEGYEFEVLKSNDWKKYRPTVICVEANHQSEDWADYLADNNYKKVIFDGLNEYYVANESIKIFDQFAERVALLTHSGIRSHNLDLWEQDIERIKFLEDFTDKQDKLIRSQTKQLEQEHKHSLKDKPFALRVKVAAKGLTVDYLRSKSKSGS